MPMLDEDDTLVDSLALFEVAEVIELGTATPVLDKRDPLAD